MLLQKVSVAMGLFAFAFASVVKLQGTTIPTYPDACASECVILTPLNSANSTQDVAALCTPATGQGIITCYDCIQTDAPGELTPQNITNVQSVLDSLVSACASLGSPIPAISLPGVTDTATATGATLSSLTNGGPTAAPSTSGTGSAGAPPPSTTTTSHSGAMTLLPQTFGVAGLVVALTAMMVV